MERTNYCVYAAESSKFPKVVEPPEARQQVLGMDKEVIADCMVTEAGWYKANCFEPEMVAHPSGEVMLFMGSDKENPLELNATLELWIENDKLTLTKSCAVFIPAGCAHGKLRFSDMQRPVAYYAVQPDTNEYVAEPKEATAAEGTYANNWCLDFQPSNGPAPNPPEGLMTGVIWIDGGKVLNAAYAEGVWFHEKNPEAPPPHTHTYGEFLSFFGADPEHPEELGCEMEFHIEGEPIQINQSCLLYVPAGVVHNPFWFKDVKTDFFHTSGYSGTEYSRQ